MSDPSSPTGPSADQPQAPTPTPDAPGTPPPATSYQPTADQPFPEQPTTVPQAPKATGPSRGLIVGLIVGAVVLLLLCGVGAVAAVLLAGDDDSSSASESNSPSNRPSVTASAAASAAPQKIKLVAPDQLGPLRKAADQSEADPMRETMRTAGVEEPFAALYENAATPEQRVVLWGGTGEIFGMAGAEKNLASFFDSLQGQFEGGTLAPPVDVPTSSLDGKLRCTTVSGVGVTLSVCGWVGQGGLLGMIFAGLDQDKAVQQAQSILPLVAVKS